jgi:hypothetical protein
MGTRKTQYAFPKGICDIKPINGKISQMACWESDQFVVLMNLGNSCGRKGLTGVTNDIRVTSTALRGEKKMTTKLTSKRGLIVTLRLIPHQKVRYELYSTAVFFVDAAHFVHGAFLGFLWCFVRVFILSPSGRKRFNVLGALNASTKEIITVTNETYINAEVFVC